jgi:hypothetical protein
MPAPVVLTFDIPAAPLARARELLNPKQLKQGMFQAVKRTTATAVTAVKREVRAESFIKKKYIDRAIVAKAPSGDPPIGMITVKRMKIPAIGFQVSESKKGGVRIRYLKGKPSFLLKHAFIATVKAAAKNPDDDNEHQGVFFRTRRAKPPGKLTKQGFAGRLRIKQQMGPAVIDVVSIPEAFAKLQDDIAATLTKNMESQIDRFIK